MDRREIDSAGHLAQRPRVLAIRLHTTLANTECLDERRWHHTYLMTNRERRICDRKCFRRGLDNDTQRFPTLHQAWEQPRQMSPLVDNRSIRFANADLRFPPS